jgi:RNA polymerase sigma factor (sigma-70 family)
MHFKQAKFSLAVPGDQLQQTDAELVGRFKAGDEQAFNEIVRRYQERIFTLIFRFVRDFDEAHDIAQETSIRVHAKLEGFRSASSPYTWIYKIALNLSLNYLRKKKLRSFFSLDDPAVPELAVQGGPDEDLVASEVRDQVDRAIGELPSRQRSIFYPAPIRSAFPPGNRRGVGVFRRQRAGRLLSRC